ncbi:MAG: HAD family hydrolase [Spongiibacteraceae bacterium]|nr:HAD family hydrolase [Spongiibacteraceae bacterium]
MGLSIFDLDNTLLGGDSDHAWGQFLVDKGAVDASLYQQANDRFYQQYLDGSLNINAFLEFALAPMAKYPKAQLDQWHRQFMDEVITPLRLPKADALLAKHRAQGDFLLIITATNEFVTEPIAHALGVDHLIATIPQFKNGAYTGKVEGTPTFQGGKVERLKQWLKTSGHTLDNSYFYSDSINDLPLLRVVEHPIAVDPDQRLTEHAKQQGWPIISLRDA